MKNKALLATAAAIVMLSAFLFAPVRAVTAAVVYQGMSIFSSTIDSTPIGTSSPAAARFTALSATTQPSTVAGTSAGYVGWGKNGTGDMDFYAANNGTSPSFYWYYLLGTTVQPYMWLDQTAVLHVPNGIAAALAGNVTGNLAGNVTGNLTGNVTGGAIFGNTGAFGNLVAACNVCGGTAWSPSGYTNGSWMEFNQSGNTNESDFINYSSAGSGGFFWWSPTGGSLVAPTMRLSGNGVLTVGSVNANLTGNVTGNLSGTVTGTLNGNVTGNVTGNVSGSSGSTTGNANTANSLSATPSNCGPGNPSYGIQANGAALCMSTYKVQSMIVTTGICTTNAGVAGSSCSFISPTWPTAFADANYAVSCTAAPPYGSGSTPSLNVYASGKTNTYFAITLQSGQASSSGGNSTSEIDCIGSHI